MRGEVRVYPHLDSRKFCAEPGYVCGKLATFAIWRGGSAEGDPSVGILSCDEHLPNAVREAWNAQHDERRIAS